MQAYLPDLPGMQRGLRKGRNVYEGSQRAFGLQFGNLRQKVMKDPLYREAARLAKRRSVVAEINRMNIFLIMRFFLKNVEGGHIIEFGSYRGGNAIFMAHVASRLYPQTRIYALDTFAGMPATDKGVDAHNEGDFSGVDLKELRSYVNRIGLSNLEFVEGRFEDTTKAALQRAEKIALAHIDCDIAASVQFAYDAVKPRMSHGGYIIFDDATVSSCAGATEAVEDLVIRRDGLNSEQIFPHFVFRSFGPGQPT